MFADLSPIDSDPILGLMAAFASDARSDKVDLGVGVYRDERGQTPLMQAVHLAEKSLVESGAGKAYLGMDGVSLFNLCMQDLLLGSACPQGERAVTLQAPGGCGALHLGAKLLQSTRPKVKIWVSDPTWGNHIPLLGSCGLEIEHYPYYDPESKGVRFGAMLDVLSRLGPDDVILLHGCCHNPCGADLRLDQWQALAELLERTGSLPFVDMAYQGFGEGLEEDAAGLRCLVERLPELILASSCSKNFGLYRERTGAITVLAETSATAQRARAHLHAIARSIYSMPPAHGALLAAAILSDDTSLRPLWERELGDMRQRIANLRLSLAEGLSCCGDFGFISQQKGMFSFLGLSLEQVRRLREEFAIYMVDSSRINMAGINPSNIDYLLQALRKVIAA